MIGGPARRLRLLVPLVGVAALGLSACSDVPAAGARGAVADTATPLFPDEPLPDSSGWGTHVLTVARAPDGAVWVGTYGQGIYVSRDGSGSHWENLRSGDSTSISWDFVDAIAFSPGAVWYGTVGNGWGVSRDGGRSWRNWTFSDLGPQWQYVAPDGIVTTGDTAYIATADGLRVTSDYGASYREVGVDDGLPSKYLLAVETSAPVVTHTAAGTGMSEVPLTVWDLRGASRSLDGGRTWHEVVATGGTEARQRLAAVRDSGGGCRGEGLLARICRWRKHYRDYPDPGGKTVGPSGRAHFWFRRPIDPEDDPYLDQTYTYGSTMGGNFQQHQGVEFNNPEGTPVHAIGDGVVAYAGKAEAGSNTVAILHDRRWKDRYVWSVYYHNVDLQVHVGDRVKAGQVISHVGHTGRATNDHLHLEIHTTPTRDSSKVVDPEMRYPPYTRNPQLWIRPLPGTGAIAGRVLDAKGDPVPGAHVYGVTKPEPTETPFSFAETYEDKAHSDPLFGEHFAIGDVPAGRYVLGVEIDGRRVFRSVRVAPDSVTEVEFRP